MVSLKFPNLAVSFPLVALSFGLLTSQVFAAPTTVSGSDIATAPSHFARRDGDGPVVDCSYAAENKVNATHVEICRDYMWAIGEHGCVQGVDVPLKNGHTTSFNMYCAWGSAMLIPNGDAAMPLNERYGSCHEVANAVTDILTKCTEDGMVSGSTVNLGPTNNQAGVMIVKSVKASTI